MNDVAWAGEFAKVARENEREAIVVWLRRVADNFVESLPPEERYSDEITEACEVLINDLADKIEAGWHGHE